MFSIAAINDTDSENQWQSLAPTKEAQEFHLSQLYHDGLLRLQDKEYEKARELLESVLKDPLLANSQVENSSSDGHISQFRFLALKNLGTVFLEQGPATFERALDCYLQAVEIDSNDSVIWNKLGTLSCTMGLLSISRWAFEQGLVCSPNNWNCMEKLLEVLISIGDEVACLSVAELILRHWPSHSRASHVKNTIEEPEQIPFTPRGVDKLEPKHSRLKFPKKRKSKDEDLNGITSKRLKQTIDVELSEASWISLVGELLGILLPLSTTEFESSTERYKYGDVRLRIQLPPLSEKVTNLIEMKGLACKPGISGIPVGVGNSINDKEGSAFDEQPQERRSSRLERLRTRKPGKEESDFATNKDVAKVVKQSLLPYLIGGTMAVSCEHNSNSSFHCTEELSNPLDSECTDLIAFVQSISNNFGAYHIGHLLLEKISNGSFLYQDSIVKILNLEKITRSWGRERTPECSLFLSELYYDSALRTSVASEKCSFMSEASYHLCKIIESVALKSPFPISDAGGKENCSMADVFKQKYKTATSNHSLLGHSRCFWIRFFWLSASLSQFEGDEEKSQKEFSIVLSLFMDNDNMNGPLVSVFLPHCKAIKKLTVDRVLHEIILIELNYLLKNSVSEMLEKNRHTECINLLAPLLLSTNNVHFDVLCTCDDESKGFDSIELLALDILIKSCEMTVPMDIGMFFDCHRRKLQILLAGTGLDGSYHGKNPGLTACSFSEGHSKENPWDRWKILVADEVKVISQSASQIKSSINFRENFNQVPIAIIGDIQFLLLTLMCNIAGLCFSRKPSGIGSPDSIDQIDRCYFVDAAIAFCKLQHLNMNAPIKSQTELVVAIHDMLAEFGICCARGNDEADEGTFLKLAIKHLLALDMKLKSSIHSSNKGLETKVGLDSSVNLMKMLKQTLDDSHITESLNVSQTKMLDTDMGEINKGEANHSEENFVDKMISENILSHSDKENTGVKCNSHVIYGCDSRPDKGGETEHSEIVECSTEITEDEREELELGIDNALDQCFYCLYGLNLRSDSSSEEDLVMHKNTSQGEYQTKEQCADVFQYILPYAKASSRTGLVKLRRVLRTIRKHFPQPPDNILAENAIDKFLDCPELCEDKLLEEAGSNGFLDSLLKIIFSANSCIKPQMISAKENCDPYMEVYSNLYYLLAQSEDISATDKWAGFVLTKEGEEFVEHNANLFKYDLLYNPLHFESWKRLATLYDEEVDLLLNDGSKQINVVGWRKGNNLPQRVESSRRRSRRCLLMTLALANTPSQQGEIHELLALVYYDGLQNVVPFYDQRSILPIKDAEWKLFCENAMSQFKKAFTHKEDWSHAFYVGKLCEKLGCVHDMAFSYYTTAIALNSSAVDPFYRMHASRLKLLCKCRKQNVNVLKIVAAHSFTQSAKETVANIFSGIGCEAPELSVHVEDGLSCDNPELVEFHKFEKAWNVLYSDCLSALETCIEGDLKHFHKARYMLAQGLYRRGGNGDLEKAKEELSFCFKSSRSLFTINMWEIDSMVNKARRKTPGPCGNRKVLEVYLAESSRKFITCIRKYILFYLKLLEETGDNSTLERAYICLRSDKRFSLCLEDLVPVVLLRYVQALTTSIHQASASLGATAESVEHLLEKLFNLFLERVNLWPDICYLPELKSSELTESRLYGSLYDFVHLLERNFKVEVLESINEKIRKRLKNPKLSNSNCSKVYRHVSAAWCRSLVVSMALVTPLLSRLSTEIHDMDLTGGLESDQLLCVDLQSEELWSSAFEDPDHLKNLATKWNPLLSKIKNVIIKRVSDEDLETAATLLRSSYNFYKDTSCALLPSGINLYMVPAQLVTETYIQPGIDGVDILDMNTSRKLLLWAYSLLHGHCPSISHVIKYCEENTKCKIKKGTGGSSTPPNASLSTPTTFQSGGVRDGVGKSSEPESHLLSLSAASLSETQMSHKPSVSTAPETECTQTGSSTLTKSQKNDNLGRASLTECNTKTDPQTGAGISSSGTPAASLQLYGELCETNRDTVEKASSSTHKLQFENSDVEMRSVDLQNDMDALGET